MEKEIIDVDFTEEDVIDLESITDRIKFYTSKQVCELLDISSTTLTYYRGFFEDVLDIPKGGNQKRYTEENIKKLKFICDLKNKGFALQQIKEICQETEFKDDKALIKDSNPLSIHALAQAMLDEQAERMNLMQQEITENIAKQLAVYFTEQKEKELDVLESIKDDINLEIEKKMEENFNKISEELKKEIQEIKFATVSKDDLLEMNKKNKGIFGWFKR